MQKLLLSLVISILTLFNFTSLTHAKDVTYDIPRVQQGILVDGDITDLEWGKATKVSLNYEINPGENIQAPVKTTAYMMEDGQFLYIAFKASDPNPENIKAYYHDRDRIFQDDFVGIIIDTFNAKRRGFEFFVNPLGAQGDLTRDDTQNNEDSSWNTLWSSAGKLTDKGYQVEMAIPFRSIRFPSGMAKQEWSIQFLRIYPRDARRVFADAPEDRNINCSICQYNKVQGFENLEAGNQFELTPTLTLSQGETRDPLNGSDWTKNNNEDVGLDLRWAITEDWITNATINPDFSQVEADAAQLDVNTTDALFLNEARPFFLEGRDYFSSYNNLLYTRNIANPDYGLKLTGKTNGTTHAFLAARDERTSFIIPGALGSNRATFSDLESDVFVARMQNEFGEQNNVGIMLTHRKAEDYKNQVAALDGRYHLTKADYFRVQYMSSDTNNSQSVVDDFSIAANQSDDAYSISYRHNKRDYLIRADYNNFGQDFRADMGFISRVDYEKTIIGGEYRWFGEKGNRWTRWSIFGDWDKTNRLSDGQMLEEEIEIHMGISGPLQFFTNFGVGSRERYHESGSTSNGDFRSGMFDEEFFMMWAEFRPTRDLWFGNFFRQGDQLDFSNFEVGTITLFEPSINWQIGQHLSLRYDGVLYDLDVPASQSSGFSGEHYKVNIANFRAAYQFDLRSRLRLTTQYSDVTLEQEDYTRKDLSWQLLYSYKVNPQSLIFVGYSSQGFEEDPLDEITESDKTLFAKFSYVWQS